MGYFIYIFIFSLLFIPQIFDQGKFRNRNLIIYFFILPLFICGGYMVGSDWRGYEIIYNETNSIEDVFLFYKELGYILLGYLFKIIGFSFWQYAILIKFIGYYIFLYFYRKYAENNTFGVLFFFVYISLVLWIDHPARNFVAVIIYLFSLKHLHERNFYKYLFITLLASFFHFTAIFLIPIYFTYKYFSTRNIIIISTTTLIMIFFRNSLFNFINDYLLQYHFLDNRLSPYIADEKSMTLSSSLLGLFFHIMLLTLLLINRERIEKKFKYGYFIIYLSFVFFVFLVIGVIFPIFFRFNLFFIIPYSIAISYMVAVLDNRLKHIYIYFLGVLLLIILDRNIKSSYKYVPYSNYIEYLFKDKPPYYYRSQYNINNSPYTNR